MSNGLITIKIGGEAGFGIKVAGATLGKVFLRMGYEVFDYTEYPSLIRGGHNTFEITIGKKVYSNVRPVNLLIALNQEACDRHLKELSQDAGIIYDPERTKIRDVGFRLFPVPFGKLLKGIGGSDLMKNTVALGAALGVLNGRIEGYLDVLNEIFAKKSQKVVTQNVAAAKTGFDYVKQNFPDSFAYQITPQPKSERIYLTGNEAVALGAIAGGCRAYFAYPMTPSTSVLVYLARYGPKVGMLVAQPEDEISVIGHALGASFAGVRSMVGTSGGGFSLMVESLGLAGITETPLVIFLAQRGGPATGLPTWSEQGDLRFILHAAQGEFPRIVLAPGDQEECFYLTAQALNFAERYQMPVFILSDKNLAEGGKTVPVFDQSLVKIERGEIAAKQDLDGDKQFLRYRLTESGISPRVFPGTKGGIYTANSDEHDEYGYSEEGSENRIKQMNKRMRKLTSVLKNFPGPALYGKERADLTIVSWGSTKGPILQALEELSEASVNFLHFSHVWPFPTAAAKDRLRRAKKLLVIENNMTGQFDGLIRQYVGRVPEESLRKYDGRPFWPEEIVKKVTSLL